MKERIKRMNELWHKNEVSEIYILGKIEEFNPNIIKNINVKKINWIHNILDAPKEKRKDVIIINPTFFQKFVYPTIIPQKMRSKIARPWTKDFLLVLKLSEKGISFK